MSLISRLRNRKSKHAFFQDRYVSLVENPNHSEIWWHSMPLPDGRRIDGAHPDKDVQFKMWRAMGIANQGGLVGRNVLDIGANDGFFTLAALMAGAAEVTAVDAGWGTWPHNIRYACDAWNVKPKIITADFREYDFHSKFDVIFFLGVLYHLEDVFSCMRRLDELLAEGGEIYLETQMSQIESDLPLFEYASDIYPTIAHQDKPALKGVGVSSYLFPNEAAVHNLAYSYDFVLQSLDGPQNLYSIENPSRKVYKFTR